ncbi:MAG: hypothetical protein J7L77_06420 [Clostridiales bacterium]|nr:hypothetical protein [Clostridiales bacterium]
MKRIIIILIIMGISIIGLSNPLAALTDPSVAAFIVSVAAAMGLDSELLSDSFIDGALENMKNYVTGQAITAYAAALGIIDQLKQLGTNIIDLVDTDVIKPIAVQVQMQYNGVTGSEAEWLATQTAGMEIAAYPEYGGVGGMPDWAKELLGHDAYYMTCTRVSSKRAYTYSFNYASKSYGRDYINTWYDCKFQFLIGIL